MGIIKTNELDNGNIGLEIIYGGTEAPFGGVDTSAPPAYIDPRCFADVNGFLVVDNKLVAASLQNIPIPTLWGGNTDVELIGFGNFYDTVNGQVNYALGVFSDSFPPPFSPDPAPTGVAYNFYMTTWLPRTPTTVLSNSSVDVTLFDSFYPATQAAITLECVSTGAQSNPATSGAAVNILEVHTFLTSPGWIIQNSDLTVSGGAGYAPGDFLTIVQGSNFGAIVTVLTIGTGGSVATWDLTGSCGGYSVGAASVLEYINTPTILKITGPAGTVTYSVGSSTLATITKSAIVNAMVAAINAGPDLNVTAAVTPDGNSIVLTAINAGIAGNTITVQDLSSNYTSVLPPIFYFACRVTNSLIGGAEALLVQAPRSLNVASIAEVGGTLYIGNIGSMILAYTEPGQLRVSTLYSGVEVLRKFGGGLLGLRLHPQLGTLVQNTDRVMAWSSPYNLNEWAPVTTAGNVTGAGFAQLSDIGDYLTGIIVSNGTAFIIRSQGISYATASGSATLPFPVSHIGLGDQGEGGQISELICQYDQIGVFVGNTEVYQIAGSISSIGQKIKTALYEALSAQNINAGTNMMSSAACAVYIGGAEFPLVFFNIVSFISSSIVFTGFVFNPSNGTWMTFDYNFPSGIGGASNIITGALASTGPLASSQFYGQTQLALAYQGTLSNTFLGVKISTLVEGVVNNNSNSKAAFVTFPQEEVSFGRDITIDAIYIALVAKVTETVTLNFSFNGRLFSTQDLTPAKFNSVDSMTLPTELQIFPSSTTISGAFTTHAPQLRIDVISYSDASVAKIRFTKFNILGSFDPNQRPV